MNAVPMKEPLMFLPTVTDANGIQTMSSREIADLTGKRHDHVLRDTRQMLIQLYGDEAVSAGLPDRDKYEAFFDKMGWGIDSPDLGNGRVEGVRVQRDARGFVAEISLDYTHTMTLVAGYKVKLRKAIIDKWQELERATRRPVMPDLNNPATLRLLLADYANDKIALEEQVAELAPKAEALDRIATADGSMCITDAAKTLQVQPKAAFQFLRAHRWIYSRQGGGDIAYQDKLASGLLEHKTTTIHRSDGSEKVTTQVRVTPKGLARLAKELQPVVRAA